MSPIPTGHSCCAPPEDEQRAWVLDHPVWATGGVGERLSAAVVELLAAGGRVWGFPRQAV